MLNFKSTGRVKTVDEQQPDDIGNVVFIDVDNGSSLTASAELNSFGALQFNWQKKVGNASSFSAISEDAVAFKDENSDTLAIAEEGKYKV